jgi:type I restriction enzyme, S subunit
MISNLGAILTASNEKAVISEASQLYSLTIKDGFIPKPERYVREFLVKDLEVKKYKVVKKGQLVFNPSNLRWGAIGGHWLDQLALTSPIYEVLSSKTC